MYISSRRMTAATFSRVRLDTHVGAPRASFATVCPAIDASAIQDVSHGRRFRNG